MSYSRFYEQHQIASNDKGKKRKINQIKPGFEFEKVDLLKPNVIYYSYSGSNSFEEELVAKKRQNLYGY